MTHPASNRTDSDTPALTLFKNLFGSPVHPVDTPSESNDHFAPVLMMPAHDAVLFAGLPPQRQNPVTFAGSTLVHIIAASVIWFGLGYKPPVTRVITERYAIRQLDLHTPEEKAQAARIMYPHLRHDDSAPASNQPFAAPLPRVEVHVQPGPQTLIQADLTNPITLPKTIPVPRVILWSPPKAPVKTIVPPLPEKPTAADVLPNLERPNQELTLSQVNVASSMLPSRLPQVQAGTTTPITIHRPGQVELPPALASQLATEPTPATILSLSDQTLKNGTAVLPPVSESLPSRGQTSLTPGQAADLALQSSKGTGTQPGGAGAGRNPAAAAPHAAPAAATLSPQAVPSAPSTNPAPNAPSQFATTTITLPKDGRFGAVILGDSIGQEFPEAEGVWGSRVAYTTYLHVGLSRSWIMQYSLPGDVAASAGGTVAGLDAPWPYTIVRPNLAPGAIDADALMIRGFVDDSGRFESLSVVFPQPFANAQFVLAALKKWQFRPAMQNGRPAKVEVLIVIPELPD